MEQQQQQLDTDKINTKLCPVCKRVFDAADSISFCPDDNSLLAVTRSDGLLGSYVMEKYVIKEVLDTGGWSRVYLAEDSTLGQTVAVKVLRMDMASEPDKVQRFQNEAKAVRTLHHPNIAATYDYGLLRTGQPFLVMEYVDGVTLRDAVKSGKFTSLSDLMDLYLQVCAGLDEAHRQGLVHRDLKPSNVMISFKNDAAEVKILDFGLAKRSSAEKNDNNLTRTGETLGTPPYMSPEQCVGGNIDLRADIYSLGCMLFESVTGRVPFSGESPFDCMVKHMSEEPPSFSMVCLGKPIPKGLENVVRKCLAKDPDARYQSVMELADDLKFVMGSKLSRVTRPHYLIGGRKKDNKLKVAFTAGLGLLVLGGGFAYFQMNKTAQVPGLSNNSSQQEASKPSSSSIALSTSSYESLKADLLKKIETCKADDNETGQIMACQQLLSLDERQFGATSDQVADDHLRLGEACLEDNDTTNEALEHFQKALFLKESSFGFESEEVLKVLRGLANCYSENSLGVQEVDTWAKVLRVESKLYGEESLNAARTRACIGLCLYRQANIDSSISYLKASLETAKKLPTQDKQLLLIDSSVLAVLYATKDQGTAIKYGIEASELAPQVMTLSPDLSLTEYSRIAQQVAVFLAGQKHYRETEQILRQLVGLYQSAASSPAASSPGSGKGNKGSSRTTSLGLVQYRLALVLDQEKKTQEADDSFLSALETLSVAYNRGFIGSSMSGNRDELRRLVLTDYVEFLRKNHKAEGEKECASELAKMGGPVDLNKREEMINAASLSARSRRFGSRGGFGSQGKFGSNNSGPSGDSSFRERRHHGRHRSGASDAEN